MSKKDKTEEKPLLLSAEKVATLLGLGKSMLYNMQASGQLGPMPIRLGRRRLWRRTDLENWVSVGCPPRERWLAMLERGK